MAGEGGLGEGVHALINHFDGLRPCRPGEKPATSKHQRRSPEKPKPENIHNNFRYLSLPVARHEMAAFRGVQQQNPPECSLICRGMGEVMKRRVEEIAVCVLLVRACTSGQVQ